MRIITFTFLLVTLLAVTRCNSRTNVCAPTHTASLVSWFNGDSLSEGIQKDSQSSNNATIQGTIPQIAGKVGSALSLSGESTYLRVTDSKSLNPTTGLSVVAWVNGNALSRTHNLQPIVSKWKSQTTFSDFSSLDLSPYVTAGTAVGSSVFDGRYQYFSTSQIGTPGVGKQLRYDTQSGFGSGTVIEVYDATTTDSLHTVGYQGAIYDGRYIYYIPYRDGIGSSNRGFHGRVLRYDTRGSFTDSTSWSAYDAGTTSGLTTKGLVGGYFDGRYIYMSPFTVDESYTHTGNVLRFDTQGDFKSASSWTAYNAGNTSGLDATGFGGITGDGRYVYFVPNHNTTAIDGIVLRYDSQSDFTSSSSWSAYDAGATLAAGGVSVGATKNFQGAIFDGRYVYFVPSGTNQPSTGKFIRYDTHGSFTSSGSWLAYDAGNTSGLNTKGYNDSIYDGRYIYFGTNVDDTSAFHGRMLRYDTTGSFSSSDSWIAFDASNTGGTGVNTYESSTGFDGRYIYFSGRNILRYDTTESEASYSLDYSNSMDFTGRSGSLPGFRFRVNTTNGAASVSHHGNVAAGEWHLVAGTYSGTSLSLYVDGSLVNQVSLPAGQLINSPTDLLIGGLSNSNNFLAGAVDEVQIYSSALSPQLVSAIFTSGSSGVCRATVSASLLQNADRYFGLLLDNLRAFFHLRTH